MRVYCLRALASCAVLLLCFGTGNAFARIVSTPVASPEVVVINYFTIANQALVTGDVADFALVYDPNATLTASNPTGVTITAHGVPAIERWLKAWAKNGAGLHMTETSVRSPMPGVVLEYVAAFNSYGQVVARCAHVFAVREGLIVSDDFITFNHVTPAPAAPGPESYFTGPRRGHFK